MGSASASIVAHPLALNGAVRLEEGHQSESV